MKYNVKFTSILQVINIFLAIFLLYKFHKICDYDFWSSKAVPLGLWVGILISVIAIGFSIKNYINNKIINQIIILWPFIHIFLIIISLILGSNIFFVLIRPPFFFIGEVVALGYEINSLTKFKMINSKMELLTIIISMALNIIIIRMSIVSYSKDIHSLLP
ncbi:MAG: hypothetical protein ABF289_19670 [Clostridiales bacterium]